MPKSKRVSIRGLGEKDSLVVQKSTPLLSLWRSDLTLAEFKILDTYLARINSHNPEEREVCFEKGELENILEVQRINNDELKARLKHLMGHVVEIPDEDEEEGFRLVTLFDEATAKQDESGLWTVKMMCTVPAMKYIFNIENLGYLRYKLRCITSITSRYTYIMFTYLEKNRFRKSWEIDVDELKRILCCENEETYKQYYRFNDLLLKRVQKELHEKTECRYTYEPIKHGRSVVAVRFTVETIPKVAVDEKISGHWQKPDTIDEERWKHWYVHEPLKTLGLNLSKEQCDEVLAILATIPKSKLPIDPVTGDDLEIRRYHYLEQKTAEIARRDTEKPIKHKYAYLLAAIKKDAEGG